MTIFFLRINAFIHRGTPDIISIGTVRCISLIDAIRGTRDILSFSLFLVTIITVIIIIGARSYPMTDTGLTGFTPIVTCAS